MVVLAGVVGALPASAAGFGNSPLVSAIWPRSGPVAGGTVVTVAGSGFTGADAATVDGVAAAFDVVSDSVVQVTVPPAPSGGPESAAVLITTPGGTSVASPLTAFAYRAV